MSQPASELHPCVSLWRVESGIRRVLISGPRHELPGQFSSLPATQVPLPPARILSFLHFSLRGRKYICVILPPGACSPISLGQEGVDPFVHPPTGFQPPSASIQPNGPRGISQMSLFLMSTSRERTPHRGGVNLYSPIIPWALITLIFPPLSVNGWFPRREERSKPTYCLQAWSCRRRCIHGPAVAPVRQPVHPKPTFLGSFMLHFHILAEYFRADGRNVFC